MKSIRCAFGAGALATLCLFPASLTAGESSNQASPEGLVREALRSELSGRSDERQRLLEQALKVDPNFAPARWQLGFVRKENEWLTLDEAAKRAKADPQLTAYRKLRDELIETADNHRQLARWCRKNKLKDEERIHWAKVLEFEPADEEALSALGLQLYEGRLMTREQIQLAKKQAGEQRRATQHWQPKLTKWRAAIERGNAQQVDEALRGLKELNDPAAIPALEATFAVNADTPKSRELNRVLIETVGRFKRPEATQVLLRRALVPDSLELRGMAADELKKRPMHAYVPLLIAMCPEPATISSEYHLTFLPGGVVVAQAELTRKQGRGEYHNSVYFVVGITSVRIGERFGYSDIPEDLRVAQSALASVFNQDLDGRLRAKLGDEWRERAKFVLQRSTGFTSGDDPRLWERQWNDYNDWYTPDRGLQPYRYVSRDYMGSYLLVQLFTRVFPPVRRWQLS